MPTYEYTCAKCGHEMEAFQSMNDGLLRKCPACGRPALKRKVGGGAGLIFKGTGFYITDYKKAVNGKSGPAESKPAVETKPAADNKPATVAASTS